MAKVGKPTRPRWLWILPSAAFLMVAALTVWRLVPGGRIRRLAHWFPVRPHILLITVDTLRADYLGCYGGEVVETPHIDRLAAEGIRFRRALSHVPLTLPSHASVFSGMDPLSHGVHNNATFVLESRFTTLAEVLHENGYRTGAFVGAVPVDSRFGIDQGFDVYDDHYGGHRRDSLLAERPAEEVLRAAMSWLDGQGGQRWFCWIHLFDPHSPYAPPAPFSEKYGTNLYAGEVAYVDRALGELFDFLREQGYYEDTWIVFTSDHGEGLGDHGERNHGTFAYHSTLWVPLIFRYPAVLAPSQIIEGRARLSDIMPTVLDYLDLPIPEEVQGESLRPLIGGRAEREPRPVYFESMALTLNFNWASPRGLYVGKYKYIDLPLPELYDIESDFYETRNLVEIEPRVADDIRRRLQELLRHEGRDTVLSRPVDRKTQEMLRALGYIGSGYAASRSPHATFGESEDPKRLVGFLNRLEDARDLFREGRPEAAIEVYRSLIEERPDFALAYDSLAHIFRELGRTPEALEVLEAAYRRGVDSQAVWVRLGECLKEVGDVERAVAVLESAVEKYPDHVEARSVLGATYLDQGRTAEAVRIFQDLLREDPSLVLVHDNLGSVYLEQGRYPQALEHFETALQHDPEDGEALNGLGVVYASTGRPQQAVSAWKEAVRLHPDRCDTLLNLGMMLTQLRRFDEAIPYLEQFLEAAKHPRYRTDVIEVRNLLARIQSVR